MTHINFISNEIQIKKENKKEAIFLNVEETNSNVFFCLLCDRLNMFFPAQ